MRELIQLTKNPKTTSLVIHVDPKIENDKKEVEKIMSYIQLTLIKDIVRRTFVYYDPKREKLTQSNGKILKTYEKMAEILGKTNWCKDETVDKFPFVLHLDIDRREMLNRNLSMEEIHFAIIKVLEGSGIDCLYTDDNEDPLLFRIEINKNDVKKNDKKFFTQAEKLGNSEYDNIMYIQNVEKKIMEKIALRGLANIKNAYLREQKGVGVFEKDPVASGEYMPEETDKLSRKSRWVIDTEGTNLLQVLALDYIDATRTISNDIHEVYDILGLECARTVLINEIINVMAMENMFLNQRHVEILVDTMTNKGRLIAIDRHGMKKSAVGPLARASFEESDEHLYRAAVFAENDNMAGVSANIMVGQVPPCGTGVPKVMFDEQEYMQMFDDKTILEQYQAFMEEDAEINEPFKTKLDQDVDITGDLQEAENDFGFSFDETVF